MGIKEAFNKAASSDFVKDAANIFSGIKTAISDKISEKFPAVKEFFDKLKDKVSDKLNGDKESEADGDKKDPSFDKTLFHEDMNNILSDDKKSDALMKATIAGTVTACQLKADGKSPDDIAKISSAVSQYTASLDACSLQYSGIAASEAAKAQLNNVASETGVDAKVIREAYEASIDEINACADIADKAASGETFDKSQFEQHPALKYLLDEDGSNKAFDVDSVDIDAIGKAAKFYDKNDDVYGKLSDDARVYALLKSAAPVITEQVVQNSVIADQQREREHDAAELKADVGVAQDTTYEASDLV